MFEEWYLMNNKPNNSYLDKDNPNFYEECSFDMFNELLNYSPDRKKIKKDSLEFVAIIQYHTNPLNEYKEDRKLICSLDINLNRGDIVYIDNDTWLVLSNIQKNSIYQKCQIRKTNNILTIEYKDLVHEIPCILTNGTLYSDGIEVKNMILSNDKRSILLPYNEITKNIKLQQRFMFNHNSVLSVSQVDDYTFKESNKDYGIIQLSMIREEQKNSLDDVANNLADNSHLEKEEPIILQIDNKPIQLEINKSYKLNPKLFRGNKEILDKDELDKIKYLYDSSIIGISNNTMIGLKNDNTIITIQYKKQCIQIPIQIVKESVNSSNCNIIGNDFIKIGKIGEWIVELYDNQGDKVEGKIKWELSGDTECIKTYEETNNSLTLIAYRKTENIGKKIIIKCKTLDGLSYDIKEIIIKNII